MKFKRLEIDNFLSYGEGTVIEFNNNGIVFVKGINKDTGGSNGGGKSSLFEGIVWALFGKTIRGVTANDVVNRFTNKNTRVSVHVDDYVITRYRKHSTHKNNIVITKGGQDVSLGTSKKTTNEIEQIFNITYETFINSIILGSNVNVNFLGADSNASRRSIFENILGLDKFPEYRERAKEGMDTAGLSITKINTSIESQLELITAYNAKKEDYLKQSQAFEEQRTARIDACMQELSELQKIDTAELLKEHASLEAMRTDLQLMLKDIQALQATLNSLAIQYDSVQRDINTASRYNDIDTDTIKQEWAIYADVKEKVDLLNTHIATQSGAIPPYERIIKDKQADIANSSRFLGKPCSNCGTVIDQSTLEQVINNSKNEIATAQESINTIQAKIDKLNQMKKDLLSSVVKPKYTLEEVARFVTLREGIPSKQKWLDKLQVQIDEAQTSLSNKESEYNKRIRIVMDIRIPYTIEYCENAQKTQVRLETQLVSLKEETNPYVSMSFDTDIVTAQKQIDALHVDKAKHEESYAYYKFWFDGFGNQGLKIHIFELVIDYFNKQIEYYLNILSNNQFAVTFDKDLSYTIAGTSYKNNSSGERKRIDLAVMMALFDLLNLRTSSSSNILILDEVLDSLDELGVESVNGLLHEMKKVIPNIYVISHNNSLGEYFPNTLTIVKSDGVSCVQ
jgi:DNA repair exonuclease SbcCD ATPase subunit